MVATIRQFVTVQSGGKVAVESPELREGESAEVIVIVERSDRPSPSEQLKALEELRESMKLTPEAAEKWIAEIYEERMARREPGSR